MRMKMQPFSLRDYFQKVSAHNWIFTVAIMVFGNNLSSLSPVETDESVFLLATCYYRSGRINEAHWVLTSKGAASHKSKFLLAKCAYELKQ